MDPPGEYEYDAAPRGPAGAGLSVLREVQLTYEAKMEAIEHQGGSRSLERQVSLLRSWVADLASQNALLAGAVEELEREATSRLMAERRTHNEIARELQSELGALRRRLVRKDSDLRGLVEVLRRLREFDYCTLDGIHFFEVTESDIFGSVEWRKRKISMGDSSPVQDIHTRHSRHRRGDTLD